MSRYWKNELNRLGLLPADSNSFESSVVIPNVSEIKAINTKLIKPINDVLKALAPPKSDTHIIAVH